MFIVSFNAAVSNFQGLVYEMYSSGEVAYCNQRLQSTIEADTGLRSHHVFASALKEIRNVLYGFKLKLCCELLYFPLI